MSKKAKLTLGRETLRRLDSQALARVRAGAGAAEPVRRETTTCPHIISVLIGL